MKRWVVGLLCTGVMVFAVILGGMYAMRLRSENQQLKQRLYDSHVRVTGYMYLFKITQYRAEQGVYPHTLGDLVPDYISQKYLDSEYCSRWSYSPDIEEDTFELLEVLDAADDSVPLIYSPEFYGIYNKVCVERILADRKAEEESADSEVCLPIGN